MVQDVIRQALLERMEGGRYNPVKGAQARSMLPGTPCGTFMLQLVAMQKGVSLRSKQSSLRMTCGSA